MVGRENYAIKDVETIFGIFPPKKLTAKEKKELEFKPLAQKFPNIKL